MPVFQGDLFLLGFAAALLLFVALRGILRGRRQRARVPDGPFLVFPVQGAGAVPLARPAMEPARWPAVAPVPVSATQHHEEAGETVCIDLAAEGTVQLLPGRLEVIAGAAPGTEYRFLRDPGREPPEFTLGRAVGPARRHLQIAAHTVSRQHARMRYQDRRWWIANLSQTNPSRVNRREIGEAGDWVALSDGDHVQLGEVELRYREGHA